MDASCAGENELLQAFGGADIAGAEFAEKNRGGRGAENGRDDATRLRQDYGGQAGIA